MSHRLEIHVTNRQDHPLAPAVTKVHEQSFDLWTDAVVAYGAAVAEHGQHADGVNVSASPMGDYLRTFFLFDRGADLSVELWRM